jgi:hypothetical protein
MYPLALLFGVEMLRVGFQQLFFDDEQEGRTPTGIY